MVFWITTSSRFDCSKYIVGRIHPFQWHYYCCSCRNWQSNICSNIKLKNVGDTLSWFKAPPSHTASCMVMCIKILNFYAFKRLFFHYSSKAFVSSIKLQFAAHLLGKCGDRLFTSEQGCVGSLSNLGDFEISQMSCFAKFCKCPPCARVVIFRLDWEENQ